MKQPTLLILLALALSTPLQAQTSRDQCSAYQTALGIYQDQQFAAYQTVDSAKFYSQAPPGETVGKCNSIPCIGSPVFLIEKAQQYIDKQFDLTNKYSSVRYMCYHKNSSKSSSNSVIYRFIWELSNYGSAKYIGIEVDSSIAGMGNA